MYLLKIGPIAALVLSGAALFLLALASLRSSPRCASNSFGAFHSRIYRAYAAYPNCTPCG
jgi:hypothetical protein